MTVPLGRALPAGRESPMEINECQLKKQNDYEDNNITYFRSCSVRNGSARQSRSGHAH